MLACGSQKRPTDVHVRAADVNPVRNSHAVHVDDDAADAAVRSSDWNHEVSVLGVVVVTQSGLSCHCHGSLRGSAEAVLAREAQRVEAGSRVLVHLSTRGYTAAPGTGVSAVSRVLVALFQVEDGVSEFVENVRVRVVAVVDAAALRPRTVRLHERRGTQCRSCSSSCRCSSGSSSSSSNSSSSNCTSSCCTPARTPGHPVS